MRRSPLFLLFMSVQALTLLVTAVYNFLLASLTSILLGVFCVGTTKTSTGGVPKVLAQKKASSDVAKLKRGTSLVVSAAGILCCLWSVHPWFFVPSTEAPFVLQAGLQTLRTLVL